MSINQEEVVGCREGIGLFPTPTDYFNHANIIDYAQRPFMSVGDMNETLIRNWNERVREEDRVFHLGDFGFGKVEDLRSICDRLNGSKVLIRGNHDYSTKKMKDIGFDHVWPSMDYDDPKFVAYRDQSSPSEYYLVHKPQLFSTQKVLCGHIHDQWKAFGNNLNMCVEVWGYMPVSLEEIDERMNHLEKSIHDLYGHVHLLNKEGKKL